MVLLSGCGLDTDPDGATDRPAATGATTEPSATTASTGTSGGPTTGPTAPPDDLPQGRDVVVTSITDGDTFRSGDERVRLIGIDTPEISGGIECFGREATAALEEMIPPGTTVRLVRDVSEVDRYDRTLAYVYRVDDGLDVNLALVEQGYAVPMTYPPDVARADEFVAASRDARDAGRGLWSAC